MLVYQRVLSVHFWAVLGDGPLKPLRFRLPPPGGAVAPPPPKAVQERYRRRGSGAAGATTL